MTNPRNIGAICGNRRPLAVLGIWLLGALAFVGLGGLRAYPPPLPQIVLVATTLVLILACTFRPSFRSWVLALPPQWTLGLHLSRFVGFYFLILYDRGELPYEFAVLGGWGDIAVAFLALGLLAGYRRQLRAGSLPLQLWNLVGLVDILFVVGTAGRLAMGNPESMAALTRLPLGLLPTFLVPLILFSHGVLLLRGIHQLRVRRGQP